MADDDFSELMELAQDLDGGGEALSGYVRKAVQVTSGKVKKDAQASVRGRKGFGHAASAITYDTKESAGGVESEIGYDKARPAGRIGNLVEFGAPGAKAHMLRGGRNVPVPGSPSRPLAPSHDLGNALLANEGDFVDGLSKAVADSLKDVNL